MRLDFKSLFLNRVSREYQNRHSKEYGVLMIAIYFGLIVCDDAVNKIIACKILCFSVLRLVEME